MGRARSEQPKSIGQKVKDIRLRLGLTQEEMYKLLCAQGVRVHPGYVSLYEISERVPTLLVTLAYAKAAGISTDVLIDDELELPKHIRLSTKKHISKKGK